MSDDLVKRLRSSCYLAFDDGTNDYSAAPDAADRIEELVMRCDSMARLWAKEAAKRQVALGRIEELERERDVLKQIAINSTKAQLDDNERIEALELALTQSRAETAAAYERAASMVKRLLEADDYYSPTDIVFQLQALVTPDQSAALDAIKTEARAQGMREAADMVQSRFDNGDVLVDAEVAAKSILAAIKGAKA